MRSSSNLNSGSSFRIAVNRGALRSLASLLNFVSKVGKELIIEVERSRLTLRTLNDAKSAFAHIIYDDAGGSNESFDEYNVNIPEGEEEAAFKVNVKPICSIMKNLKKVQSLVIYTEFLPGGHDKLVFELTNDTDIKRTHKFDFQEAEVVNAFFDETVSSRLVVEPKILLTLLDHLHQTSGEIEMEVIFHITHCMELITMSKLNFPILYEVSTKSKLNFPILYACIVNACRCLRGSSK